MIQIKPDPWQSAEKYTTGKGRRER